MLQCIVPLRHLLSPYSRASFLQKLKAQTLEQNVRSEPHFIDGPFVEGDGPQAFSDIDEKHVYKAIIPMSEYRHVSGMEHYHDLIMFV